MLVNARARGASDLPEITGSHSSYIARAPALLGACPPSVSGRYQRGVPGENGANMPAKRLARGAA